MPCQKCLQNAQNKRFGAIFCSFLNINRSTNQQTIQLDAFRQDLKLKTGSEIFLVVQGVIFSKNNQNWSKIAYLVEYSVNVAHENCKYFEKPSWASPSNF